MQEKPTIVCDTAHNAHGIRYIGNQLESEKYDRLHIVFGVVKDKDLQAILPLLPKNADYYFTKPSIERALNEKHWPKKRKNTNYGALLSTACPKRCAAREKATENDFIFIGEVPL